MRHVGVLVWVGLLALPNQSAAGIASGIPVWTNRYSQLVYNDDDIRAIAVDSQGNVFVTGGSRIGLNNDDIGTIGYSRSGVPLWTNVYDGAANRLDFPMAIATDAAGNVFVTGGSHNGTRWGGLVLAYSGTGKPLWTNYFSGVSNRDTWGTDIAVDNDGTVFVVGRGTRAYSTAGAPLWADTNEVGAAVIGLDHVGKVFVAGLIDGEEVFYDLITVAYSTTGMLLWTNRCASPTERATPAALAVDVNGNVFVTGSVAGENNPGDYLTIGYSGAGVPLWTNRYDGPQRNGDAAKALAVDSAGRVYVTGSSLGGSTTYDYATIAYAPNGIPLWTNRYHSFSNYTDEAMAVVVDAWGTVIVSGNSRDSNSYDLATIGYSAAGVALWTNRYDGNGLYDGMLWSGIMAAAPDGVVIAGSSERTPPEGRDYAVVKYFTGTLLGLAISSAGQQIQLKWPSDADGFRLQGKAEIGSGVWSDVIETPSDNGTFKIVTVPAGDPRRFFRLQRD